MMIDLEKMYEELSKEAAGHQRRMSVNSALGVFFGVSQEGYLRVSFISTIQAPKLESTKTIRISQGFESATVYWTCFDLVLPEARNVFFTFCNNLIETINGILDEKKALELLKRRYITWKTMFKKDSGSKASREVIQGLYGELYYLHKYMIPKYGVDRSIQSWSGPDAKSKDFSIDNEWYEIKTIGANAPKVHISSLAQLSSTTPGHLVVIRAEAMSEAFNTGESCIGDLLKKVLAQITSEATEAFFLSKISSFGLDITDEAVLAQFDIKSVDTYKVDDSFPRLKEDDVKYEEMCDIEYSLIVASLKKYKED